MTGNTYLFRGPVLHYRHPRPEDLHGVFACFRDWPADRLGPFTLARAQDVLSQWITACEHFARPLSASSEHPLREALIVHAPSLNTDVAVLTYVTDKQNLKEVVFAVQGDHRQQQYFHEMIGDFETYACGVLLADEATFHVHDHFDRAGFQEDLGPLVGGETAAARQTLRVTNTGVRQWRKDNPQAKRAFEWLGPPYEHIDLTDLVP